MVVDQNSVLYIRYMIFSNVLVKVWLANLHKIDSFMVPARSWFSVHYAKVLHYCQISCDHLVVMDLQWCLKVFLEPFTKSS